MSTITARLPRPPHTLGSYFEPVSNRLRHTKLRLRRWNESLDADRHASPSELILRRYTESRFRA